jgi:MFS transporter, MHS family, shikimate and dehydroshikimate transport protein
VRYSGASFGFQLSAAIGGGFAPLIATTLAAYTGSTVGVSIMLIILALVTLTAAMFARETKNDASLDAPTSSRKGSETAFERSAIVER